MKQKEEGSWGNSASKLHAELKAALCHQPHQSATPSQANRPHAVDESG